MLSIAEVECPHCGARGRLVLPNQGAVLIGPCPRCQEMVAVFCGVGLPLDKEIMVQGNLTEKHTHLMDVLTSFLDHAISETLAQHEEQSQQSAESPEASADAVDEPVEISQEELEKFREVNLRKLDDKDYFNTIFKK